MRCFEFLCVCFYLNYLQNQTYHIRKTLKQSIIQYCYFICNCTQKRHITISYISKCPAWPCLQEYSLLDFFDEIIDYWVFFTLCTPWMDPVDSPRPNRAWVQLLVPLNQAYGQACFSLFWGSYCSPASEMAYCTTIWMAHSVPCILTIHSTVTMPLLLDIV